MSPLQAVALVTGTALEGPFRRVCLQAPALAARLRPGQFVTGDLGGPLRQPLLPADVRPDGLEFLVLPSHPAAALVAGGTVNLLGPLGRPFVLPDPPGRLLLAAEMAHLPAILPAAGQALADGCPVTLLLWAPTGAALYPPSRLPPAVEVHVLTADGSAGHSGSSFLESELLEALLTWADRLLVAADPGLYPAVADTVRALRLEPGPDFAQAVLLPPLVCGVGACQGCVVQTRRGYRRACTEGPAFDLLEMVAD